VTLRTAVVGLGSMGSNHVRVWRDVEGAELVAVADADSNILRRVSEYHGVPGRATLAELIARDRPDAVSIAVPTSLHEAAALEAISAGVHVLVEKPLAPNAAAARRIAEAARVAGVIGMVGHIERFNPALVEMRLLLETGELGEVFSLTGRRVGPFPPRIKDVGVIHDIATHDLDLVRFLLREPFASLSARTSRRVHEQHEDLVSIIGTTLSGVVLTLEVNWLTPRKQRETLVLGERGMLVADTVTQDLFLYRNNWQEGTWLRNVRGVDEGDMTRFALRRAEPLRLELQAFADAIRAGAEVEPNLVDGVAAIELADMVLDLSRSVPENVRARFDQPLPNLKT